MKTLKIKYIPISRDDIRRIFETNDTAAAPSHWSTFLVLHFMEHFNAADLYYA